MIDEKLEKVQEILNSTQGAADRIPQQLGGVDQNKSSEATQQTTVDSDTLFRRCLMDNLSQGVIFVNHALQITCWNRSAEIITGLSASSMLGVQFTPEILGLVDPTQNKDQHVDCPVSECLNSRKPSSREYSLVGRSGREAKIELTVSPVNAQTECLGCVVLVQDLTASVDLKRQLSYLQNASTLDPLTHVANRTEFEKCLREYVNAHRVTESKCCLIVCDLDFFKKVNDTYGHHIGDQALVSFAQTLKQFVRSRDVVARYGGEEFVILCANCDLENAVQRAEQIRMSLNQTPQQMLDGKTLSASFGISELQQGEDGTEFFIRADKALLAAKQAGRNCVQTAKVIDTTIPKKRNFEISPNTGMQWRKWRSKPIFCEEYRTSNSSTLLADKLRGFMTENDTHPLHVELDYASISVLAVDPRNESKKTRFRVDVEIHEAPKNDGTQMETFLRVSIFPGRQGLFGKVHRELHTHVVTNLRRFLMITDDSAAVKLNPAATSSGRED